jgi:hypothetical protein
MGFLVLLLVLAAVVGGLLAWRWFSQERVEYLRDRARLQVIEGQLAALRAALRINAAEYMTRQRMHAEVRRPDFRCDPHDKESWVS